PDIIKTFGAFLAVLIAYEIFSNIRLYIRSDVFPMKLVVATAIMAIARKIIILDMAEYSALDLVGMGVIVVGLGITYWLISLADRDAAAKDQPPVAASSLLPGSKTKANTD
ncbi:MAG: phosphate-starvation-inducible PsiE family protein, partial [Chromatiaceae bacterium]|nr:phosphate-starvation-inducible PsiE family protein [Chromatiaceae bacterium]